MKSMLTTLGVSFGFLLICALSMGNRMYLLLALLIVVAWVLAYISIRTAEKSVRVSHGLNNTRVNRGETVAMQVSVSHKSLLPIAPVKLKMRATSNTPSGVLHLTELGRRTTKGGLSVCRRAYRGDDSRRGELHRQRCVRFF